MKQALATHDVNELSQSDSDFDSQSVRHVADWSDQ